MISFFDRCWFCLVVGCSDGFVKEGTRINFTSRWLLLADLVLITQPTTVLIHRARLLAFLMCGYGARVFSLFSSEIDVAKQGMILIG